jgi:hypothetical protein
MRRITFLEASKGCEVRSWHKRATGHCCLAAQKARGTWIRVESGGCPDVCVIGATKRGGLAVLEVVFLGENSEVAI